MKRLRILPLLVAIALAAAACGTDGVTVDPPANGPTPSPTTQPTNGPGNDDGEPPANGVTEATAYFVRSADRGLYVEPETHELDQPTVGVARAAIEVLLAGDTIDPNLSTAAPAGTRVLDANIRDGVLIVDLSEDVRGNGAGSAQELAFAQQLAHTATQFDGVAAVELWVDGEPVDELWGHLDWTQPIEPDPFALSPVDIQSPQWGESVKAGQVTVSGEATVFEANVTLRLIGPDGEVVEEAFATAKAGAPERGAWSYTFAIDEPGRWTVEAAEDDPSGGEGRPPLAVQVEFEVVAN